MTITRSAGGPAIEILDCGDSAVRVTVTGEDRSAAWRLVHGIGDLLQTRHTPGVTGTLPTYDAILVQFDCVLTDHAAVRTAIDDVVHHLDEVVPRTPRTFDIPVVYGGERGLDLDAAARHLGIPASEVVAIHTARPLLMRCFGSPAGAPMLDGPAFALPIPRLASPRPHVAAGAVAVAGRQAVVSARPAPGGWFVLGFTPLTLIDPSRDPLTPYWPGDSFRFHAIPEDEFDAHAGVLS